MNPMLGISSGTLAGILRDNGIENYAAYATIDSFQLRLIQHAERVKFDDWREVVKDFFKGWR
jgi:hypothetical protein